MQFLFSILLAAVPSSVPPDTLVVCPVEFQDGITEWIRYRTAQGHRILVVPSDRSPNKIKESINDVAKLGNLETVLLIGDADPNLLRDPRTERHYLPTQHVEAKVNVRFGSERDIASDNWYADLDHDLLPDLAIGRIAASSSAEVEQILARSMQYEQSGDHGPWRRRVNLVAGVGGFGPLADGILESATKKFLTERIPSDFETSMTYGSWQSPYCPDPRRFHATTLDRFNEGCLFWVYVGHGHPLQLDQVQTPGQRFHIFDRNDVRKLNAAHQAPIAIFMACYTGAFDLSQDCLAEEMLRAKSGPVAVLGASRVALPYAMAVMANEMLDEYFTNRCETIGELFRRGKCRMAQSPEEPGDKNRQWIDLLAASFSPTRDMLEDERREHVSLFHLFGDPLMRLKHPSEIAIEAPTRSVAGETIELIGKSPIDGTLTLELVYRRDRMKSTFEKRSDFIAVDFVLEGFQRTYDEANDKVCSRAQGRIKAGDFQVQVEIPDDTRGACHLRAFVEGETGFAVGATDIFIKGKVNVAQNETVDER